MLAKIKSIRYFSILRDYRATIEELISGGNIEIMVHKDSTRNFTSAIVPPIMGKNREDHYLQEKQIYVLGFTKNIETEGVIQRGEEEGLVPADIFDLLTMSNAYPQSPGIKKSYILEGGVVALGTLFPKIQNGKMIKGANLAPLLCSERPYNGLIRRELRLNLTANVDDRTGHMIKSDDWWPTITKFAFKLKP